MTHQHSGLLKFLYYLFVNFIIYKPLIDEDFGTKFNAVLSPHSSAFRLLTLKLLELNISIPLMNEFYSCMSHDMRKPVFGNYAKKCKK